MRTCSSFCSVLESSVSGLWGTETLFEESWDALTHIAFIFNAWKDGNVEGRLKYILELSGGFESVSVDAATCTWTKFEVVFNNWTNVLQGNSLRALSLKHVS